jgi:hypothetical protein
MFPYSYCHVSGVPRLIRRVLGWMIGFIDIFFYSHSQLQSITAARSQSTADESLHSRSPGSVLLQLLMVLRPLYLGIKHPSGAYDQIFITVRQMRLCWFGALSLTRGRVCRLLFLLALSSAVILGSESLETRDYILLSQIRDFPFRRLLRLSVLTCPDFVTSGRTE